MTLTRSRTDTPTAARRHMLAGGAVLSAAMVGAGVGNYVVNAAAARLLGPAEFGDASIVISILLVLAAAAGCLQLVAARRVARDEGCRSAMIDQLERMAWFGGSALGLVLVLGAPAIAGVLTLSSALPLVVVGLGVPWYCAQAIERGVLQGRMAFGILASTFLIETLVRCAATIVLLAAGVGVVGVGIGLSTSFVVTYGMARFGNRRVTTTVVSGAQERVGRELASMSLMLLAQMIATNADLFVVKALADGVDAGQYAAVAVLGRAVFFCSWSIVTALFPFSAAAASDREVHLVRRGGLVVLGLGGVVATGTAAVFGGLVLSLAFGASYREVASLLAPYVAATSFFTMANFVASTQAARGDLRAARLVLAGAIVQTVAVIGVGSNIVAAAWIQLPVMAATVLVVAWHRGSPKGPVSRR
ncbi:MAG: oligosaccharide flippase family protein [Actinomycetota bacterium]